MLLIAAAPIAVSVTFYAALLADCVVPLKMWLTSPCTDVQRCVVKRQVALLGGTGAALRTAQRPLRGGGGRLLILAHWALRRSALSGRIERLLHPSGPAVSHKQASLFALSSTCGQFILLTSACCRDALDIASSFGK